MLAPLPPGPARWARDPCAERRLEWTGHRWLRQL